MAPASSGVSRVGAFYRQVVATYPLARRIYAAQGNWSIPPNPDVLATDSDDLLRYVGLLGDGGVAAATMRHHHLV